MGDVRFLGEENEIFGKNLDSNFHGFFKMIKSADSRFSRWIFRILYYTREIRLEKL